MLGKILWVSNFSVAIILAGCFVFILIAIPSSRTLLTTGALAIVLLYTLLIWCLKKEFNIGITIRRR